VQLKIADYKSLFNTLGTRGIIVKKASTVRCGNVRFRQSVKDDSSFSVTSYRTTMSSNTLITVVHYIRATLAATANLSHFVLKLAIKLAQHFTSGGKKL